jgi:predicted nucleic-acid-binding Zn-ribbon protein
MTLSHFNEITELGLKSCAVCHEGQLKEVGRFNPFPEAPPVSTNECLVTRCEHCGHTDLWHEQTLSTRLGERINAAAEG